MDMKDTLATPKKRVEGLDDFVMGVPIVNRLLGLAIPVPTMNCWSPVVLGEEDFSDPDRYFGQLIGAIFDKRLENPHGWVSFMADYERLLDSTECLNEVFARVVEMSTLSDEAIVNEVSNSFAFERLDLLKVFEKKAFVSIKINHAYWEELTCLGFASVGKLPYIREVHRDANYSKSRIDDLVIKALSKQQENAATGGAPAGCFSTSHFSFGVSFGNGDHPTADYLSVPIGPIHKSAAIGSLSFLKSIFPANKYVLADGTAAKGLIWRQQCDEFFARLVAASDAVIFIVPSHLRAIEIGHWKGHTATIVIPALYVHEMWPAVLPMIAGKLASVFSQWSRVSILVQAGVISAPLGILVDLMRDSYTVTQIRYFDMGQVLDVATYPTNPIGTWIGQPWVRDILARTAQFPLSLRV